MFKRVFSGITGSGLKADVVTQSFQASLLAAKEQIDKEEANLRALASYAETKEVEVSEVAVPEGRWGSSYTWTQTRDEVVVTVCFDRTIGLKPSQVGVRFLPWHLTVTVEEPSLEAYYLEPLLAGKLASQVVPSECSWAIVDRSDLEITMVSSLHISYTPALFAYLLSRSFLYVFFIALDEAQKRSHMEENIHRWPNARRVPC